MTTTKTRKSIAYAMSDMAPSADGTIAAGVVAVPAEHGGCGQQHRAQVDENGHPYIECELCAPWLTGHAHGFAATPQGVPLTPDEMGEVEISKRQGEVSYSMAMRSLGETMGNILKSNNTPTAPAPSLMEQLAALSPADRAQLAAVLVPPATQADGTADAPGDTSTGADAESEPKRGGSRTRPARG